MNITMFISQFWGWLLVIMGVAFLVRGNRFWSEMIKLHEDRGFVFISGWISLPIGLFTVLLHNVWVIDWPVIITIFGWLTLVKGIVRTSFPEVTQGLVKKFYTPNYGLWRLILIVVVLLGIRVLVG